MNLRYCGLLGTLVVVLFISVAGCGGDGSDGGSPEDPSAALDEQQGRFVATLMNELTGAAEEGGLRTSLAAVTLAPGHDMTHNGMDPGVSTDFDNCNPDAAPPVIEQCAGTDFSGFEVTHTFTNFSITDACGDEIVMTGTITCTQSGRLFTDVTPNEWSTLNAGCSTPGAPTLESFAVTFTGGTSDTADDTNQSMAIDISVTGFSGAATDLLDAFGGTVTINGSPYVISTLMTFLGGEGCL